MWRLLWPGSRFWVRTVSTTVCHVLRELNGTRTTPLKSDQMVEHFKRTLKTMISLFLKNTLARPELSLHPSLMLNRTAVYETAGCTPNEMMFGRGSRVLPDLLYRRPEPDENSSDVTIVMLTRSANGWRKEATRSWATTTGCVCASSIRDMMLGSTNLVDELDSVLIAAPMGRSLPSHKELMKWRSIRRGERFAKLNIIHHALRRKCAT